QMYLKLISEQLTGKPAFEETDTKTSFYSQSIDKAYIESENLRIAYHKKIARLTSFKEAESLLAEFKDIFGVVPGSEQNYVYSVVLKNLRQRLGILNISLANKEVGIEFKVNPNAIMSKKPVLAFCVKNQNIRLKSTLNSTIVYLKTDKLADWTK
ncbi:TRCF domain-containing protein, partial [Campylobacter jejuni]|uniref:TRCF domain-containing protein n=1 Tax=Campylobacter jejuni TaxID=197 RepID=UPI002B239612